MRTHIEIDDDLMRQAMRSSGAATERAVVEEALRLLVPNFKESRKQEATDCTDHTDHKAHLAAKTTG